MGEVECRECDGTGEALAGRRCGGCRGQGVRVVPVQHDGSLCEMEAELALADADLPELPWERSYEVAA